MKSKFLVAASVLATTFMFPASAWAAVTLQSAVTYPVGSSPRSVTIGDVNGDADLDLIVANANDDTVSVLLGDDNGTFLPAVPFPIAPGDFPTSVTTGDVNGDSFRDVITANELSNNVTVLMGNGDGTFDPAVPYGVTGASPQSVAIANLDGDTDLDLAVANISSNNVSVLLNNGNGTFTPAAPEVYATDVGPNEVVAGDINGDGNADLVTANLLAGSVSVLLGNGDGTFQLPLNHVSFGNVGAVAIGQLNGDGIADLAITVNNNLDVRVLLGVGDGTFNDGQNKPVGSGPSSVAIGDLDADGIDDIIVTNQVDDTVGVLAGHGDGTFDDQVDFAVGGSSPTSVRLAHLDDDGKLDVVTANANNNTVSVLLTRSEFTTGPTATITGTVRQGQTLTAQEGTPVPTQDSFAYEWFANGVTIAGATAKTFKLTSAEVSKKISVKVTAKKAGLTDASDTSPETAAVQGIFVPGPKASITGTARVGSTLTANTGSPSPKPTSYSYRWYVDGKRSSNVAKTLKLTSAHHGKRIQVRVYAIRSGYLTATSLSPATARISNVQAKIISLELNDYTVRRGQRVYADIERLAPGEPWSIILDGRTLVRGKASSKGTAITSFTIPTNATVGIRTIRANGMFPDRTDPDRITIR